MIPTSSPHDPQRNVVCNINTGEMYLLPTASAGHATVQELSSGRSISFDEFESKLGLQPEVCCSVLWCFVVCCGA